ncbi:MAG TPA: amidohydrolase family protein [Steroidobacteraceae bacterium]|nr:amidohydrolase family protein [Steroidobacteraceae bacterium]
MTSFLLAPALACLPQLVDAASNAPPTAITAYVGATLIDGTGGAPTAGSTVVVRGERITAAGKSSDIAVPAGARVVILHGRYLIPGLINTHVHLASPPLPDIARAYLRRELYSGITAVRDMAGDARLLAELKREALRGEIAAPDVYFSALVAGPTFFSDPRTAVSSEGWSPGTAPWMRAIDERSDLRQVVAEAKGTGATGIKIYADLKLDLIRAVAGEAHRQGMKVWAHAFVPPTLPSAMAGAGVDSLSHADLVAYELADPVPQTFQEFSAISPSAAAPNPKIERVFDLMAEHRITLDATVGVSYLYPSKLFPKGVAPAIARQAYLRGVAICTGTDDDPDFHAVESRLLDEIGRLVHESRMTPMDAIRAATASGASVIGQTDEMGTIAAGKLANFVVLTKDPLADIRNLRAVEKVVKRGKIHPRAEYVPANADLVKQGGS